MKKILSLVFTSTLLVAACSDSKTSTKEKEEINVMDSTEKKVKDASKELEDQTEKVEKSLEKLDKEFKDSTN